MSSTVEKNDVDISRLFYYGDKFTIFDINGTTSFTVYIRLVGDAELNQARVFALRCSADMRSKLKDKNSDMHKAYIIENYDDFSKDDLVLLAANYSSSSIAKEALDLVSVPIPTEPKSDAPLEEQERYQKEVDEYPLKRFAVIREKMDELLAERKEKLLSKTKEEVIKEFESLLIATLCEQEMLTKFKEMCTYFGTYKDSGYKNRLFKSYDEFNNVLPDIKKQFIDSYASLEVSSDELKK